MRFLTVPEVLELHRLVREQSGGAPGVRDAAALDSAVAQPQMTYGGQDLYPGLAAKAAALAFSLIQNHPFVDGNKRVGHAALETFLVLNGHQLDAPVDDQEQTVLDVAAGKLSREKLATWVQAHLKATKQE
jgi:death-on-curing protein